MTPLLRAAATTTRFLVKMMCFGAPAIVRLREDSGLPLFLTYRALTCTRSPNCSMPIFSRPAPGRVAPWPFVCDPHTPDGTPDFDDRLNEALWMDFFSPRCGRKRNRWPAAALNRRLVFYRHGGGSPEPGAVRNFDTAAAHLLIDGPFNINSTSVAAWQAVFASLNGPEPGWTDPETGTVHKETVGNAFLRHPVVNGGANDGWRGYRASVLPRCSVSRRPWWTPSGPTARSARSRNSSTVR